MCNRENLKVRAEKARAATDFALVVKRDSAGLPAVVSLPGSAGRRYEVSMSRSILGNNDVLNIDVECVRVCSSPQCEVSLEETCEARVPCYHAMAAVVVAAYFSGYRVAWCSNELHARSLSNISGYSFSVTNMNYLHEDRMERVWGVYYKV